MIDLSHIAPSLRELAVPIDTLRPDPANAREHPEEQIAEILQSVRTFGQQRPIVAKDGVVRAGSGVLLAMKLGGFTHIACSMTDLPDERLEAYAIVDNRLAEKSTWHDANLAAAIMRAKAAGFDATQDLGFGSREVSALLARLRPVQAEEREPAPAATAAITNLGDVWLLGPHRLKCGDSFSTVDVMDLMTGSLADMALMDPPFAIYGSSTGIGRDIADDKMVRPFFEGMFRNVHLAVREFAHVYVHCDWRSWSAVWDAARRADIVGKNCLVWDKGHFGLGGMYGNAHEFVGFFAKLPPARTMVSDERRGLRGVVGKANILRFPRVGGDEREHNAAKPVAMLEELIGNSSDPGETVLDLFGGSGSTLIASERTGRRCFAMELEPKWCDVIVRRWERESGLKASRLAGKQPDAPC